MEENAVTHEWRFTLIERCADDPGTSLLVLLGFSLTIGAWLYATRREAGMLPGSISAIIATLRCFAISAVCLIALGIERLPIERETISSVVAILTDASASMALPATNQSGSEQETRGQKADPVVEAVATALSSAHELRQARFAGGVAWKGELLQASDSTRISTAIDSTLQRFSNEPIAGLVLITDGGADSPVAAAAAASRAAEAGIPVHCVGVGPLTESLCTRVVSVEAPLRAFAGDPIQVVCRVQTNRVDMTSAGLKLVMVEEGSLVEEVVVARGEAVVVNPGSDSEGSNGLGVMTFTASLEAPGVGVWRITAALTDSQPGDEAMSAAARIEVVDQETRVLIIAGGPTRDYRYLRDVLQRDDSFDCSVLLQSGRETPSTELKILDSIPSREKLLDEYDAVVMFDPDLSAIPEQGQAAIAKWASRKAAGIFYVAGSIHTPAAVRRSNSNPLLGILPVSFTGRQSGLVGATNTEPRGLRVDPGVEGSIALGGLENGSKADWSQVEIYAETPDANLKVGATSLIGFADGSADPFLSRTRYGAGRVVYLASGEVWRLRRLDPEWFARFYVETLRWASRGRLLGEGVESELLFSAKSASVGDTLALRFATPTPEQPAAVSYSLTLPDGSIEARELVGALDELGRTLEDSISVKMPGSYVARLEFDGDFYEAEAVASVSASELATTTLDQQLLDEIARETGGTLQVVDTTASAEVIAAALLRAIPSKAETRTVVGEPDVEFRFAWSSACGAAAAAALIIEWAIRRGWRLA